MSLSPILVPLPLRAAIFFPKISEKWVNPLSRISIGIQYSNPKEEMWLSDSSLLNESKGWLDCPLDPFYLELKGYPQQFIPFLNLCAWKEAMSLLFSCQPSAVYEHYSKSQATPHLLFFFNCNIFI